MINGVYRNVWRILAWGSVWVETHHVNLMSEVGKFHGNVSKAHLPSVDHRKRILWHDLKDLHFFCLFIFHLIL